MDENFEETVDSPGLEGKEMKDYRVIRAGSNI